MNPPPMERQVAPTTVPPFVPRVLRRAGIGEESVPGRRSKAYSAQGATVRAVRGGRGINMVGTVLAAADREKYLFKLHLYAPIKILSQFQ